MQGQGVAALDRPRRWRQAAIVAAIGWVVLVTIFFAIQSGAYAGLPAALAEWEFDHLGEAFPVINYFLLVALFFLPAGLLLLLYRRQRRREDAGPRSRLARLVARGTGLLRIFVALIVGLAVAILLLLVEISGLPTAGGPPARITVPPSGTTVFKEGPATLAGRTRADRTASYDQNLLLTRRTYRFVPVQAAGSADPTLRFFVATEATGLSPSAPSPTRASSTGILRHAGLPGAVVRLYRDAGYAVAADHYVLYPDRAAIAWPLLVTLVQLVVALLVLGITAYFIQRHLRRTRAALLRSLEAL